MTDQDTTIQDLRAGLDALKPKVKQGLKRLDSWDAKEVSFANTGRADAELMSILTHYSEIAQVFAVVEDKETGQLVDKELESGTKVIADSLNAICKARYPLNHSAVYQRGLKLAALWDASEAGNTDPLDRYSTGGLTLKAAWNLTKPIKPKKSEMDRFRANVDSLVAKVAKFEPDQRTVAMSYLMDTFGLVTAPVAEEMDSLLGSSPITKEEAA